MNKISKLLISQAKQNLRMFRHLDIRAAIVTGSAAKGYADDNSDIDTLISLNKTVTQKQFDNIVESARESGGDLYHGTPKQGFAVYYYINGIKCDFGIGKYSETEELIKQMLKKPEIDLTKHLMISGFIDCYVLYGKEWVNKWRSKAEKFPKELQVIMVNHFRRFHPFWVIDKMAVERNDTLFYFESLVEITGNIAGILCGLNRMYHPGKLKGLEYTVKKMKIKPVNFFKRYNAVFSSGRKNAVKELYKLVKETLDLTDKHLPEVSTEGTRILLDMELRK